MSICVICVPLYSTALHDPQIPRRIILQIHAEPILEAISATVPVFVLLKEITLQASWDTTDVAQIVREVQGKTVDQVLLILGRLRNTFHPMFLNAPESILNAIVEGAFLLLMVITAKLKQFLATPESSSKKASSSSS